MAAPASVSTSRLSTAGPPEHQDPKLPVQVNAKLIEDGTETETAVSLRLGADGMRVQRLSTGLSGGCCGAGPPSARELHHWKLDSLLDVQKTTVRHPDDGVEVAVREEGGERKLRFVTRQGWKENKKKQANLALCLAWKQYALPRHYNEWAAQKQDEYTQQLKLTRQQHEKERKRAAERAAKLDEEMTALFSAVERGMEKHEYGSVSEAMRKIVEGAEQDGVHPQQRAAITKKHTFRQGLIEGAVSDLGDDISACLEQVKRRTASDLQINPLNPRDYRELSVRLDRIKDMVSAFQGAEVISDSAQAALGNKYKDLKAQLDDHLTTLVKRAADPFFQATPQAVIGCIGRLETISTYETMEEHVPDECEGASKRLDTLWVRFEERLSTLNATCDPAQSSSMQRCSSRSEMKNVGDLARTLGQLQEYDAALKEIRCAESPVEDVPEGVPGEEGALLLRTTTSSRGPHTAAGQAKAKSMQDKVRGWIQGHEERLKEICNDLRESGEIRAEERFHADGDYSHALVQLEQALRKLNVWAESVDTFAGGCFRASHTNLAETARKFLTDKQIAFDESLSSGKSAEAEVILAMVEQLGTVAILENDTERVLPGMRRRLMDTNDDTEKRGRELFEEENFAALKEFMMDLKAAPPESNKFKTFEKLQSGFISQFRKQYIKSKRELDDPTLQGVSTLVQSMHILTMAQPLEECIEGMGYGGWRSELQADVQRVCNSLKRESIAFAEAWQLAHAEAVITHLRLYDKCPDCDFVDAILHEVIHARDTHISSLPTAIAVALGTQGTEPQPKQIDTIVEGLQAAVESSDQSTAVLHSNSDVYKARLAECNHAVQTVIDQHIQQWEVSLRTRNIEGAHTACRRLEILKKAQAVEVLIKTDGRIDLSLISRRLEEAKTQVMSAKHLRETRPEALEKSLSGLKRVDEEAFNAGWEVLIGHLGQSRDQRLGDLGSRAKLTEPQMFHALRQDLEDLHKFKVVLRPYDVDAAQLNRFRQELLDGWVKCIGLIISPDMRAVLRDVTSEATCIQNCASLDGDEKAKVDEAVHKFDEARKEGGEYVEKMVRVYREVIEQIDCTEPTTLESVDSDAGKRRLTECLRNLQEDESLIPPEHGDISYEHAVQHLASTIRKARDMAKSALGGSSAWPQSPSAREDDLGQVARCSEGIKCLTDVSIGEIDQKAVQALEKIKEEVSIHLQDLYDKGDRNFAGGDFQAVNEVMDAIHCAQRLLKPLNCFNDILRECSATRLVDKMKEDVQKKTSAFLEEVRQMEDTVDIAKIASFLLGIYDVPSEITSKELKETAMRTMDALLKEAEKKEQSLTGKKFNYGKLADQLAEDESGKGGTIVSKLTGFKKWQHERFKQATAAASPEMSIPEIVRLNEFSHEQQAALEQCWALYDEKYETMLKKHDGNTDVNAMVAETTEDLSNVVNTIAGICAVWSLAGLPPDGGSDSIVRPHCCQVLSIFVLLGLQDGPKISPDGHLIQVKTGQGKSVLLGVLATLLAVNNYDVDCVCYSKYLSSRDEASFAAVFDAFKVKDRVKYDTFNGLAEASINAKGDVRKLTTDVLLNKGEPTGLPEQAPREKILLIDEVDVFFSDAFFGETYLPVTRFRTPETDLLQKLIWEQREVVRQGDGGAAKLINLAKKSNAFKDMVRGRPHLKKVFDGHVRLMVRDVAKVIKDNLTRPYEVVVRSDDSVDHGTMPAEPEPEPAPDSDMEHALRLSTAGLEPWRVGYVHSDSIDTDMAVGYETLFCYYAEQEKYDAGDSSAHPMDFEHVNGLRIECGEFSFAEMGRAGVGKTYARILGVSGTLTCLSEFEKGVIKDYGIEKMSEAPSIFGKTQMRWDRPNDRRDDYVDIKDDKEGYHQAIQNDISQHQDAPVAVLVFFETDSRLQEYLDYLDGRPHIQRNQVFAVKSNADNIEHWVEQAGGCKDSKGNATLFSRAHGRGLDFKSHSPKVQLNGGIHVVQTFLSEEESEEIQIRGRSARQDKKGTYQLILLRSDLEKFDVGPTDSVLYADLDAKRKAWTDRKVSEREETVRKAEERHRESMEFADRLRSSPASVHFDRGIEFLNAPFQGGPKSVLFLVDYSGSMSGKNMKQSIVAIRDAFDDHIDGDDHVAVTYFCDDIKRVLDWAPKETHEAEFIRQFERGDRIGERSPYGGSKLWEALGASLDRAAAAPSEYWIVLLLDGDDTHSTGGPHGQSQGWLVGERRDESKVAHATAMASHFTQDLLPRVNRLSDQKTLGGILAIAFGANIRDDFPPETATISMLGELTTAAGVENGVIEVPKDAEDSAELIKDAFSRAFLIMSETKVTH